MSEVMYCYETSSQPNNYRFSSDFKTLPFSPEKLSHMVIPFTGKYGWLIVG